MPSGHRHAALAGQQSLPLVVTGLFGIRAVGLVVVVLATFLVGLDGGTGIVDAYHVVIGLRAGSEQIIG